MRLRVGRPTVPDADADWRSTDYCVVDVETTGLNLRRDDVISIGLAPIRDGRIARADCYYRLVRPRRAPPSSSIVIHGLREADLSAASPAEQVGREVAALLSGKVVVAHAAWIEQAFLTRLLKQAGARFHASMIDTASLARCLGQAPDLGGCREPSLEMLARSLGLPAYSPHHALGDAITTAAVFLALATKAEQNRQQPGSGYLSVRALLALSAESALTGNRRLGDLCR